MNRCQNDECKRPFAPGQTVFVTNIKEKMDSGALKNQRVHLCCPECRETVEKKVEQADMFPLHETTTFSVEEIHVGGVQLMGMPNNIKDGDVHLKLLISIPFGGVSADRIFKFTEKCSLTLTKGGLGEYETEPGQGDGDEITDSLAATLALKEGASTRWAERSKNSMTDSEIKLAIVEEFGDKGETTLNDKTKVYFEGGNEPKIWIGIEMSEPATLSGRKLVKAVRAIYGIQKPEKPEKKA